MADRKKIAVIGAGVAGLTLARSLHEVAEITAFEKSDGVGGRMATLRNGDSTVDHGAQYFTVRHPSFHAMLEPAIELGVVEAWSGTFGSSSAHSGRLVDESSRAPKFVGVPTMASLPEWMSRGLNVKLGVDIKAIEGSATRWWLSTIRERMGPFDWVVVACPAPQAVALMPKIFDGRPLAAARMNACFTLTLTLRSRVLGGHCAVRYDDEIISWVADNSSRPQRPGLPALVVHSQNQWADQHIEDGSEIVRATMIERLARLLPEVTEAALSAEVHRWLFANVQIPSEGDLIVDFENGLAACGDWTIGNRVEAAFLSAKKLSDAIRACL